MTELSPVATYLPWKDHIGEGPQGPAPFRRPAAHGGRGSHRRSAGDRLFRPAPSAKSSRAATNVMLGYWERPEETAKAVVNGWMHTGDGGYMDEDGYV